MAGRDETAAMKVVWAALESIDWGFNLNTLETDDWIPGRTAAVTTSPSGEQVDIKQSEGCRGTVQAAPAGGVSLVPSQMVVELLSALVFRWWRERLGERVSE